MKAIESAPTFVSSLRDLFNNALEVGDAATAREAVEHVQAYELGYDLWLRMAVDWLISFDTPSACEEFLNDEVAKYPENALARLLLAKFHLNLGNADLARPILTALSAQDNAEATFYLGLMAKGDGDIGTAVAFFKKALALNPGHEQTIQEIRGLMESR